MTAKHPVIVVGGGLGGVATALTLGKQGRNVQLLEQSAEIAPIGYGVQIGPNVLPMLDQLGIGDEIRKVAYLPDHLQLFDADSGEKIFKIELKGAEFEDHFKAPYIAIHRVDFHEVLLKACRALPNINLNQATMVTGFSQTSDSVQAHTDNGQDIVGEALIAADGLRSRLRAQLHPEDSARDIGYAANRTIVKMADAPPMMRKRRGVTMWTGAGYHVIYYPLRDATEMNVVGIFQSPAGAGPVEPEAYKAHVAQLIAAAQPEVHEVVSTLNMDRHWSIADRNPTRKWTQGRVTLLGDSAHSTLQSLAQGAGMAIEDAVCIGQLIAQHHDDPARAFVEFERKRYLRTTRVVLESRALWQNYHCSGLEAEVRNQQWQERSNADYYRCLNWLWNPQPHL